MLMFHQSHGRLLRNHQWELKWLSDFLYFFVTASLSPQQCASAVYCAYNYKSYIKLEDLFLFIYFYISACLSLPWKTDSTVWLAENSSHRYSNLPGLRKIFTDTLLVNYMDIPKDSNKKRMSEGSKHPPSLCIIIPSQWVIPDVYVTFKGVVSNVSCISW